MLAEPRMYGVSAQANAAPLRVSATAQLAGDERDQHHRRGTSGEAGGA